MKNPTVSRLAAWALSLPLVVAAADTRSHAVGNFLLDLNGSTAGFLASAEGGGAFADVIEEALGQDLFASKHIGTPKYEDITIAAPLSGLNPLYAWIAASWKGQAPPQDGAIVAADFQGEARSQREFFAAMIVATTLPACDASGTEPAYLTLKLAPEYTRNSKASGKPGGNLGTKAKNWQPSNFRLTIGGLDCSKVAKIDAFTIKQTVKPLASGEVREPIRVPGRLEFPNLAVTLDAETVESWAKWHEDFVINGENGADQEKTGLLEFLDATRTEVLLAVRLHNLGIFNLASDKVESNADQIKRVKAEMYCERMELEFGKLQ